MIGDALPTTTWGRRLAPLVVFAAVVLSHVWWLDASLLDRTEGLRTAVAHETAADGHWLIPKLYGKVYLRKPPGYTWMLAGVERVTGVQAEWLWRLPSVLMAAALGAFLCWMAQRWFGAAAGLPTGFAFLALVALWSQSRSAEIDAMNTTLAVIAACAVIELGFGASARRWPWVLIGGAALGAALLCKGPACLPVVGGALIGGAVATRCWRCLVNGRVWLCLLLGAAVFGAWVALVWLNISPDDKAIATSGVEEVSQRVASFDAGTILQALALPVVMPVYALPVAFVLPFAFAVIRSPAVDPPQRRLLAAIVGCFAGAIGIGMVSLLANPRYNYPALPMLCPLVGAVFVALRQGTLSDAAKQRFIQMMTVAAGMLTVLAVVLVVLGWKEPTGRFAAAALGVFALIVAAWTIAKWLRRRVRRGCAGVVVLLICASVAFSYFKTFDRGKRSIWDASAQLRQMIAPARTVHVSEMTEHRPQLYYYAGVQAVWMGPDVADVSALPADAWLVLTGDERERFEQRHAERVVSVEKLEAPSLRVFIVRYRAAND